MNLAELLPQLRIPLIAAPMFRVSGVDLVAAACNAGVVGSFPTANCRTPDQLDQWLHDIETRRAADAAPLCPNLIVRSDRFDDDLACLVSHRVSMVITSVGSPAAAVEPLHDVGAMVLADVATVRHARKALQAGVDGLILLSAGAGGQTGWVNGLAFARAVREFFDGALVLAGGVSDGHALFAARALGCDLAYMGTKFIPTDESMAAAGYKSMLVDSELDDVLLTTAMTGLETNMLRPSFVAAGLDPDHLPTNLSSSAAGELYGSNPGSGVSRWKDLWSAGHSVSGVGSIQSVAELVETTAAEYEAARARVTA